ncbi:acyl-CoA dehydrogenase family protein [Micromonospora parathelypteridis]|uniref:Alkylation response protein AidB-like acyl-CoA dehydrogenase n=1 Tax=Micromonospora parathelypteridis TaxID=1839617 RepID=A0A840VW69_9ACTN|nr:acyl-CoA dehydrogenase family protein [Micromonospora parathelypteridis]MBB5480975.1 alkylation response protein AidB-like acyl-CoA dehydrogenase [Micromonospora parathelypteridis]GGO20686.1 acyl-CoA dehydrogenase [Micromonospora parathelypteridis]
MAHRYAALDIAAELDLLLGDPMAGGTPFSFEQIVEAEERDALPDGAVDVLRDWGFAEFLVPTALGGRLRSLDELLFVARTVSRRSLAFAVMYGSALLGANPVWLWGDEEQRGRLAKEIVGGALSAFAVSEADHGSDLLASSVAAEPVPGGFVLTGQKWPVGNATRARFLTTCARTGPRSFSLLLVDKEELSRDSFREMPFVRTVGLRGHDLSGIEFEGSFIPAAAAIGNQGIAVVQVLKALQITRAAIPAMSLGTMDSALRLALTYSHERRLYGAPIADLPVIHDHLVRGHVDLLIAECVAVGAARALTVAPDRLSLWSSVAKYLVPVIGDETVLSMATVLGARSYLREGVAHGVFQKLQRDHAIAAIFEGTTHVNLHGIAGQMPFVAARRHEQPAADQLDDLFDTLFSWSTDAPIWQPAGADLRLTNEGRDELIQGWPRLVRRVETACARPDRPSVADELLATVAHLSRVHEETYASVTHWDARSLPAMRAAITHCLLHAASACVATWLANRATFGGAFADGGWLLLSLQRLLARLGERVDLAEQPARELLSAAARTAQAWPSYFSIRCLGSGPAAD